MTDRILSIFAFAVLCGFLGILIWFVPRLDLGIVILLTLLIVGYDFFFHNQRQNGSKPD
jgi:hypothetical protein